MPSPKQEARSYERSLLAGHFDSIAELARLGGPTPDNDAVFAMWLDATAGLIRDGLISETALHDFWRSLGTEYLIKTIQGRGLLKPYGYSGDFGIIDDFHCHRSTQDPRFANWDRFTHAQPAVRAVRNRLAYLERLIEERAANRVIRVLVLGCGPCRDVARYLERHPNRDVSFVCLDRDPRALAYGETVCARVSERVHLVCDDVVRYRDSDKFDLIWSAGLFDYFSDRGFAILVRRFARAVAEGVREQCAARSKISRARQSARHRHTLRFRAFERSDAAPLLDGQQQRAEGRPGESCFAREVPRSGATRPLAGRKWVPRWVPSGRRSVGTVGMIGRCE